MVSLLSYFCLHLTAQVKSGGARKDGAVRPDMITGGEKIIPPAPSGVKKFTILNFKKFRQGENPPSKNQTGRLQPDFMKREPV